MRIRIFRSILWIIRQARMGGRRWKMGGRVYISGVYCTHGLGVRGFHWQLLLESYGTFGTGLGAGGFSR